MPVPSPVDGSSRLTTSVPRAAPPSQVHFLATRVTQSLSRLAAQMERVAVFDFGEGPDASRQCTAASIGSMELGPGAPDQGRQWVQATSLLTEVAAIGRSFALMSLNLRSFERCAALRRRAADRRD
jgi:hypothetical protein